MFLECTHSKRFAKVNATGRVRGRWFVVCGNSQRDLPPPDVGGYSELTDAGPEVGVAADGGGAVGNSRAEVAVEAGAQGGVGQGQGFPEEQREGFEDALARVTESAPANRAAEEF
jgi:hypothetical protein